MRKKYSSTRLLAKYAYENKGYGIKKCPDLVSYYIYDYWRLLAPRKKSFEPLKRPLKIVPIILW